MKVLTAIRNRETGSSSQIPLILVAALFLSPPVLGAKHRELPFIILPGEFAPNLLVVLAPGLDPEFEDAPAWLNELFRIEQRRSAIALYTERKQSIKGSLGIVALHGFRNAEIGIPLETLAKNINKMPAKNIFLLVCESGLGLRALNKSLARCCPEKNLFGQLGAIRYVESLPDFSFTASGPRQAIQRHVLKELSVVVSRRVLPSVEEEELLGPEGMTTVARLLPDGTVRTQPVNLVNFVRGRFPEVTVKLPPESLRIPLPLIERPAPVGLWRGLLRRFNPFR